MAGMSRWYTIGMETSPVITDPSIHPFEGPYAIGTNATVTTDTSVKRTGIASRAHNSGPSNALAYTGLTWGSQGLNGYYVRIYFRVTALPTNTIRVLFLAAGGAGSPVVGARLTTAGKIQLFNETGTPAQIGSDSAATVAIDTWYRLELYCKTAAGASDAAELRLDGVTVASASGQSYSDTQLQSTWFGWLGSLSAGASKTFYVDDVAVNDDLGSDQNSWPGEGSVVYLDPVADSALTGSWTAGAGSTSDLWDAVDNSPPAGVASGSATNTSQIKNTNTADTTGNYDANMESYSTAGLTAGDSVSLVQAVAQVASSSATNVTGAIQVVSNPVQGSEDSKTFGYGGAAGSYATNWPSAWGVAQTSPSVTLATQPVLRVGRRGTQAAEAHVCGMRLAVEYLPGGATGLAWITA